MSHEFTEPEALELLETLNQLDLVLAEAYDQLDPYPLVQFLFRLMHSTNKALKFLRVIDQPPDVKLARTLLFDTARQVLADLMRLIGVTPLEQI